MSNKWKTKELDNDEFQIQKTGSEHDWTERAVKRKNLKFLFLQGTDIDNYIVNNLYGRAKMKNESLDLTLNENTIIEGFNLDETFGHQMQNLKSN